MKVMFPKKKVVHEKKPHRITVVYFVGPNHLKSIAFVDAMCIWAAIEHMLMKL